MEQLPYLRKAVAAFLIVLISIPLALAVTTFEQSENTTVVVKWQGNTPIRDIILSNDSAKQNAILTSESEKVLKLVTFPYTLPGTTITVQRYKCDFTYQVCGFWLTATRNGQEVYTNSPVWISPPPYEVVVSEVYDDRRDILTITLKEDVPTAVSLVLQQYVDGQPLGTAVSYER